MPSLGGYSNELGVDGVGMHFSRAGRLSVVACLKYYFVMAIIESIPYFIS